MAGDRVPWHELSPQDLAESSVRWQRAIGWAMIALITIVVLPFALVGIIFVGLPRMLWRLHSPSPTSKSTDNG